MGPSPGSGARLRIAFSIVISLVIAHASSAQTVQWDVSDIGAPALAGKMSLGCPSSSSCALTVQASGADIWGTSDQFTFAYAPLTGDGVLVTRVALLQRSDDWAKAGLMVRESLRPGAKNAYALVSAARGLAFQRRATTDGVTTSTAGPARAVPVWLKLERLGSTFNAYSSSDGVTWQKFASDTIAMATTVYAGLAVTSHNPALRTTASFSVATLQTLLPSPWQSADIGTTLTGASAYGDGKFFVRGAGADVWGSRDEFRYAFQPARGDVDVITRVTSIENVNAWTKAGLMIRASLDPASAHASLFGSAGKGVAFQRRVTNGGGSVNTDGGLVAAPVWLKLERRGDRITAYRSGDGVGWTFVGEETLALPSEFFVGLAVSSRVATQLATATFEQVTIRAVAQNAAPSVSLTAPASNTTIALGASVTLSATASDTDGSIAAVDFLANGTLVTSDTTAPYAATWTPAAAGSFAVTANARDDGGATAASAAVTITVTGPASRVLSFTPSPDHDALVNYYQLQVLKAGTTTNPVLVQSIGKPAVVAGEISLDVSIMLAPLPAGSYVLVVDAVGSGGSSSSDPSAAFAK